MDEIKTLRQHAESSKMSIKSIKSTSRLRHVSQKVNKIKKHIDQKISEEEVKMMSKKFLPVDAYDPMID